MIEVQNTKLVLLTPPAAIIDDASVTVAELDTRGWDYAQIIVMLGATDIALTALKVTDADVTATSHADVTGLIFGTSTNIDGDTSSLPADDDDDNIFVFDINLLNVKRFLDMVVTVDDGSNGAYICIIAQLYRGKELPTTIAQRGCAGLLRI